MGMIEWSDRFSVNVAAIDVQHKRMFTMINDLNAAMKESKGREILQDLFKDLEHYTRSHFSTEETYFEKFKYPERMAHKAEHAHFIQKIKDLKKEYESDKDLVSVPTANFLTEWLWEHIKGSDQKYSALFNENGVY